MNNLARVSWLGRILGVDLITLEGVWNVRQYVRPSTESYSDEIWFVDRGRWVMHDGMPYDPIQGQGQGHGASEVPKIALFQVCLFRHL